MTLWPCSASCGAPLTDKEGVLHQGNGRVRGEGGHASAPELRAIERVILDECMPSTPEVMAEIRRWLGGREVKVIALSEEHPGVPDVIILGHMLDPATLLVTQDRALHNLALLRGFRSLVRTPETGWTDRHLAHVAVCDRRLPVPPLSPPDSFIDAMTGERLAIAEKLIGFWTEQQTRHFRTKRRRIRAHFGSRQAIGNIAITIHQQHTKAGALGGYRMKIDARGHGVKTLSPASEGYFLDARKGNAPLLSTCLALSHLFSLHLGDFEVTLYHLDADARARCLALLADGGGALDAIERMAVRLLSAVVSIQYEPCVKGYFFDQMTRKLAQLEAGSNELTLVDFRKLADLFSGEE